jgi:CBS domain-containing protein
LKNIHQILNEKGRQVWCIGTAATVYDALALMADKNVGALLVTDATGPVGLFSERDYARRVILEGRASRDTLVWEVMTHPILCVTPDQPVEEAMALMTEHRVRHLLVIEGGEVSGMVSIGDLIHSVIAEQKFIIGQLEHYITG